MGSNYDLCNQLHIKLYEYQMIHRRVYQLAQFRYYQLKQKKKFSMLLETQLKGTLLNLV